MAYYNSGVVSWIQRTVRFYVEILYATSMHSDAICMYQDERHLHKLTESEYHFSGLLPDFESASLRDHHVSSARLGVIYKRKRQNQEQK